MAIELLALANYYLPQNTSSWEIIPENVQKFYLGSKTTEIKSTNLFYNIFKDEQHSIMESKLRADS